MPRTLHSSVASFAGGIFLGVAVVSAACRGASLVAELHTENLSFVELGPFGSMRTLDPLMPFPRTRQLQDDSSLVGVSSAGDQLLILADSHRSPEGPETPKRYDEIDVTTLSAKVLKKFLPKIYRMLAYSAELSHDGQAIAFRGDFVTQEGRGGYGLRLLKEFGEVSTLVSTTEAATPGSMSWSEDGRALVYDQGSRVLLYHLGSGASTLVTEGSMPEWSPDGEWIAYRRSDGGAALIHPDGSDQKNILENVELARGLRWSPNSRYLLYTDLKKGGIRVLQVKTGRTAIISTPFDRNDTEIGLRWVRGMPR